ncbi:MAG: asparagine synthase (glutamine-hydrolyzing) [Bacteroidia bacterium]
MCGIAGFINCGNREELINAINAIKHRGPDSSAIQWFEDKKSGLGHVRLSILDLSERGNQPMFDKNTGNWIVLNGEIYNYKEIRNSLKQSGYVFTSDTDTEVVLYAYHKWGEGCLNLFNGMFAFSIYNEISGDLFIARDRLGIKPVYYLHQSNSLSFSSEIKAIIQLKEYNKEPDIFSLQTPVHYQIAPYTGFKNIYKLPAGHYLKFNTTTKLEILEYWNIEIEENDNSEKEEIEKLDYLLNDAVKLNLISDVPVGVMLSGGLDSSILAALMQGQMNTNALNSFTIKFEKKDLQLQGNVDDSHYANVMASKFGFKHHEIILKPNIAELLPKMVYHLDEPIADPSAISTYLISKAAKENGISVLLTGMGADEVFGGYRTYLACLKADFYQKVFPKPIRTSLEALISKIPESNSKKNFKYIRWLKRFIEVGSLNQFERHMSIMNSGLRSNNFNEYYLHAKPIEQSHFYQIRNNIFTNAKGSYLTKMCYTDTKTYMTDHNLTYSDKAMMAAGVEGRPTLIDHRIVELMFKVKPEMRIKNNVQKYLLKKVAEKYIPHDIIYRPKAPFSAPMRGWLKNDLREMVYDILSVETIKKRGLYNSDYVQKLISNNEKGIEDNSQLIWRLMVNEIWFRTFFN